MVFGYFGSLFYIGLLFTNAIAILNEERFLARSASMFALSHMIVMLTGIVLFSFSTSYPTHSLSKHSRMVYPCTFNSECGIRPFSRTTDV